MSHPESGAQGRHALWILGNFTVDDVVLPDGTTSMAQCGGNVVYGALGAAIWHARVGIAARIGPGFPDAHVHRLQLAGIDTHLVRVTEPNIHNWVCYGPGDVRRMRIRDDSGSHADMSIRPDELPGSLEQVDACHVAPMPFVIQVALVRRLRAAGVRVISVDPHEDHIAGNENGLLALLGDVDAFLPSRGEARQLYGQEDPEAAGRSFAAAGARVVVVKLGPEGSIVCGPDGVAHHVPAAPARVIDPTGAGDTYCGGFLAAYATRPDAVEAARHGAVSASFAIEGRGALPLAQVDRTEAARRLQEMPHAHG